MVLKYRKKNHKFSGNVSCSCAVLICPSCSTMAIRRAAERPRDSHVDHRFFSGFKVGSSKCANGVAVKVKLPTNHVREVRCRADPGHQTGAPKTGKRNHAAVTEVSNGKRPAPIRSNALCRDQRAGQMSYTIMCDGRFAALTSTRDASVHGLLKHKAKATDRSCLLHAMRLCETFAQRRWYGSDGAR